VSLPIRVKLTAWYTGLLAAILVASAVFVGVRLRSDLVGAIDETLAVRTAQVSLGFANGGEGEFRDVGGAPSTTLTTEAAAQLLSASGAVLESSGDAIASSPMVTSTAVMRALGGARVLETRHLGIDAEPFRVMAIRAPSGAPRVIVVAASLDQAYGSSHRLLVLFLVVGPAAIAAAAIGGWALARRAMQPVAQMTREAADIGIAQLDERIDVPSTSDELRELAMTLNAMLDRLEIGVEEKRRFISDASHELRSPLAVMAAELDVGLREPDIGGSARTVLESAREEVTRMTGIVENLLMLARSDEGALPLASEPVDLDRLARDAVRSHRALAIQYDVAIDLATESVTVLGDHARLEQVISNLIDNAIKYSGRGSTVRIVTTRHGGEARISVSDTGPGVPDAVRSSIFERFVRADAARGRSDGGTGLGLAISREIVLGHGGRIWVESARDVGTTFSVALTATRPTAGDPSMP
jgi:heavy metal sensor kinase